MNYERINCCVIIELLINIREQTGHKSPFLIKHTRMYA